MPGINYLWDPVEDNIVREIDDSGTVIAQYTTEPGLHGDLLSQHRDGKSSYYHFDGQGNTTSLTDENGDTTDTYAYNAFGEVTERTGNTVNPFQFGGQKGYYRDEETGEYEARRRPFNARQGRWVCFDPLFFQTLEAYLYSGNRPTMYADPSGMLKQAFVSDGSKNGPCQSFAALFKWQPEAGEDDGFIIQQVTASRKVDDCGTKVNEKDVLCPTPACPNKAVCSVSKNTTMYYELWRVKGKAVFTGDVFGDNPKNASGMPDAPIDTFAHVGFSVPSKGTETKEGKAIFVPWKALTPELLEKLRGMFRTGEKGVIAACGLPSACADTDSNKIWAKDILGLVGGVRAIIIKKVSKTWNCCPGEVRKSLLSYSLGGEPCRADL